MLKDIIIVEEYPVEVTMATKIEIPVMKNCPNYTHWKNLISVWTSVTSIEEKKRADSLLLTLDSEAQSLALQIPPEDRAKADGVKKILEKLDSLYEQNATQKLFAAYEQFEGFKRVQDMSVAKYISEFERMSKDLADLEVTLPQSLLAFKLLKNANLGDECSRIVRVSINTSEPTDTTKLTLAAMKATILNAIDVRLDTNASASTSGLNTEKPYVEPFVLKQETMDVYHARSDNRRDSYSDQQQSSYQRKYKNSWRDSGRNRPEYKRNTRDQNTYQNKENNSPSTNGYRMNRIDKTTGKPSECKLCGSVYHWARQCPQYEKQLNEAVLEAQNIDVNLLASSMEYTL